MGSALFRPPTPSYWVFTMFTAVTAGAGIDPVQALRSEG
jgi:hypothetical protein